MTAGPPAARATLTLRCSCTECRPLCPYQRQVVVTDVSSLLGESTIVRPFQTRGERCLDCFRGDHVGIEVSPPAPAYEEGEADPWAPLRGLGPLEQWNADGNR